MSDIDLDYLRRCLEEAPFTPYPWDGEDRNIGAFRSREELIAWYCQPPGTDGQPYRDRAFYTRDLAMLSQAIQPRVVVEFGTCQGIGTCLLHWLNPNAHLLTVDINTETFMPGDRRVPIGHLAKWQKIKCCYVNCTSCEFDRPDVDLCFIDADHDYGPVARDSVRAWLNRSTDHPWAIAWHDHNERHPGVMRAVAEFCAAIEVELQSRPDSDTVWVWGGM
jgi:hypothetical protein